MKKCEISKKSLYWLAMYPMLFLFLLLSILLDTGFLVIGIIQNVAIGDIIQILLIFPVYSLLVFLILSFIPFRDLWKLRRQEKYLNIDFNQMMKGKFISRKESYQDDDWFIGYGSLSIYVFYRDYVTGISNFIHHAKLSKKAYVGTKEGKKIQVISVDSIFQKKLTQWVRHKKGV